MQDLRFAQSRQTVYRVCLRRELLLGSVRLRLTTSKEKTIGAGTAAKSVHERRRCCGPTVRAIGVRVRTRSRHVLSSEVLRSCLR